MSLIFDICIPDAASFHPRLCYRAAHRASTVSPPALSS